MAYGVTVSQFATHDNASGVKKRDVSDLLAAMMIGDRNLLGKIKMGEPVHAVKPEWVEHRPNFKRVTADSSTGSLAAGSGTTLNVTAGDGVKLHEGDWLRDTTAGKTEIIRVTSVSTDAATVVRNIGGSTYALADSEAHAAGATWEIVNNVIAEGSSKGPNRVKGQTMNLNYTAISEYTMEVTATQQAIQTHGIPDYFAYQLVQRTKEFKRDLTTQVLYSIPNAASGSEEGTESYARSYRGIRSFLAQSYSAGAWGAEATGNVYSTSATIGDTLVDTLFDYIVADGGSPGQGNYILLCSPTNFQRFADVWSDKIRIERTDVVRGARVEKFLTRLGFEVELVWDEAVNDADIYLLDTSKISLHPLASRAWIVKRWDDDVDAIQARIISEMTLKVVDPKYAHAIATNVVG